MSACEFTIPGPPCPKPRMTQSDKWKSRPAVMRYRAWADLARASAPANLPARPTQLVVVFYLPTPASWSARKRDLHALRPHVGKPDLDNLIKAVGDSLWPHDDSRIWRIEAEKHWAASNDEAATLVLVS